MFLQDIVMTDKSWEVEIEKINGDIKLINQQLYHIKNNHLWHIERDINRINKIVWVVGLMVFSNLLFLCRDIFF